MAYQQGSANKIRIISAIHMFIAFVSFIAGIVQIAAVSHWSSYIGYGLWGGVWFFITGLLGYFSARENGSNHENNNCCVSDCLISTFMTFAIVGTILAVIFVIVFGVSVSQFNSCIGCFDRNPDYCYYGWFGSHILTRSACMTGKGLACFLLVLQVIEFCLTIASSIFCCSALCCQPRPPLQVVFVPASGGMVQVPGGAIIGGQPGQMAYFQQGQTPVILTTTTSQYPQQAPGNMPQGWQQAPLLHMMGQWLQV